MEYDFSIIIIIPVLSLSGQCASDGKPCERKPDRGPAYGGIIDLRLAGSHRHETSQG